MKLTELNKQNPKLARLNKYVAMVAFLWFIASLALLLFAGSNSAHASQPAQPQPKSVQPKLRRPELSNPAQQMTMRVHLDRSARG
jgi:preprotein translocase subunit SecG